MNPRIEKKVSKRLVKIAPKLFKGAWIDNDKEWWDTLYEHQLKRPLRKCEKQANTRNNRCKVNHIFSVGGGIDYWGEGEDWYSCFEWLQNNWPWIGKFESYPEGHEFHGYPNTGNFKPTTRNLSKLAREHG